MDSFSVATTFTAADWRACLAAIVRRTAPQYAPEENGTVLGPRTLHFAADGITIKQSRLSRFYAWSLCKEVQIDSQYIFIWLERIFAVMIPLKDLPSGMTAEDAATRIRAWAGQPASGSPATPGPGALRRAIGFLTLRPGVAMVGVVSDWAVAGFTVGSLVVWLMLDRLRYGRDAEFVPYDAPGFAWYMLPFLLGAWLASRLTRPRVEFRNILFLLVVVAPVLIGCAFLLAHNVPRNLVTVTAVALVIYLIVYLELGLRALAGRRQSRAATAVIAIAILFVSSNSALFESPTLWSEPEPDTTDYETQAEKAEDLLISQGPRIEAEVARVRAAPADRTGVYFVGFAGVGRQKVFADEIKLAAQRISDRYDSAARTVLLLNDRRDLDSHPLATVEGLKLALKDIAGKMDIEKDVLFLSLSSHGSDDPYLSVSNTAVSLRDLSGSDLAEALHESAIKWKVIVISACHAGAFIDALHDDNTLILTAAAADRTSFGCSDDRELTYFGEAFYRDALPHSATLLDAFAKAKADIASREAREHVRASNPEEFIGPAMQKKLADIDSTARCDTGCKQSVPESSSTRP
jgi:Peptidase C13 family